MDDPDDHRRIAICRIDDQVRVTGQHDKTISRVGGQVRVTHADLRMFTDAFGRAEHGIEQALSGNRIIPGNPFDCAVEITTRLRGKCGNTHLLLASMIA